MGLLCRAHAQKFKKMAEHHSSFFCSLCEKDCYFRSKFDRHLRSTSHKLQENIQKITTESKKRTSVPCTTLELASAAGVLDTETATDGSDAQVLVGICIHSTCIYSSDPLNINSG